MQASLLLLVATTLLVCAYSAEITEFPGFRGTFPFRAHSGYMPIKDGKKNMFYLFVESQNDPANDPVVLWLNGGPGCSSFDGFIYEHGPFTFLDGPMGAKQNLTLNPYSWNKFANVIYLDSPAGVGLSYSTDPSQDYVTNDDITAKDSHEFLLNFFQNYSMFSENDFYVAGESYAGIYVPTLSLQILLGNQDSPDQIINMKGYLVGNGVTDQVIDGNAWVPFIAGHAIIDDGLAADLAKTCEGNYWNPNTTECSKLLEQASQLSAALNVYNIYDPCFANTNDLNLHKADYRSKLVRDANLNSVGEKVPCIDSDRANAYLNLPEVRTAFHALPVAQKEWTICTTAVKYSRTTASTIAIHKKLLANGYRGLVYSGDTDMAVPYTGSEKWTSEMGYAIKDAWRPWFTNKQVSGYVVTYEGEQRERLTFATIKGSGHTVPEYKPVQAFYFFNKFLNNEPF